MLKKYEDYFIKSKTWQTTMFFSAFIGMLVFHKVFNLQKTTLSYLVSVLTSVLIYAVIDLVKFKKYLKENNIRK